MKSIIKYAFGKPIVQIMGRTFRNKKEITNMPKGVYERKPFTPEARAAMSAAKMGENNPNYGKERTPEMNASLSKRVIERFANQDERDKLSEIIKNSEAAKAESDRQRGGNDICDHHYIYDDSDLSKYIMKMSRSMHMRLHQLFRKFGIEIPHINVKVE